MMTKPALQIGLRSCQNTTSLGNKPICPQRRRQLREWKKETVYYLKRKESHVSRYSVIYASEIVFMISSGLLWDHQSYWNNFRSNKSLKAKKKKNSSCDSHWCQREKRRTAAQTFVLKSGKMDLSVIQLVT